MYTFKFFVLLFLFSVLVFLLTVVYEVLRIRKRPFKNVPGLLTVTEVFTSHIKIFSGFESQAFLSLQEFPLTKYGCRTIEDFLCDTQKCSQ